MKIEVKKIGNSTGLILPKEIVTRLGLSVGDELVLNETPDGFAVSKGGDEWQRELEMARDLMRRYHTALSELAK
jgi:putative addiction module antidote